MQIDHKQQLSDKGAINTVKLVLDLMVSVRNAKSIVITMIATNYTREPVSHQTLDR